MSVLPLKIIEMIEREPRARFRGFPAERNVRIGRKTINGLKRREDAEKREYASTAGKRGRGYVGQGDA